MKQIIATLLNGENLTPTQAQHAMNQIMSGEVDEVIIATFLTALRIKGETVEEITEFVNVLRDKATKIQPTTDVIDIVGTGGDSANTFNISTTTALVVAACGVPVAKHGNRSVSSKSGSADVLEALGININLPEHKATQVLEQTDITFMFAPLFHSSMKYVAPARKKMQIRTVFNILGPLLNPALASFQLMGVYDKKLVEPLAQVLANIGVKRALVVHGEDGLDEATLTARTFVCEINDGKLHSYHICPTDFGLSLCNADDLVGGDPTQNAQITRDILSGVEQGAKRDIVILNSALALYTGLGNITLDDGIKMASKCIDDKLALKKLEQLIQISNEV